MYQRECTRQKKMIGYECRRGRPSEYVCERERGMKEGEGGERVSEGCLFARIYQKIKKLDLIESKAESV